MIHIGISWDMLEEGKKCYVLLVFVCLRRCVCLIYELIGEARQHWRLMGVVVCFGLVGHR